MPTPHPTKTSPPPSGGFALVIALSLMAFVLLLLLSITTLVQVESQSASIHKSRLEARQVALLGLNVALGKLQQTAGPDQRVTARADLISNNGGASIADPSRKYLTGVWDTTDGSFKRWLASVADATGNEDPTGLLAEDDVATAPVGAETVRLFSVQTAPAEDVIVDKVSLDDGLKKYAFWVADEGIKARSNLIDSEDYFTAVDNNDVDDTALRTALGATQSTGVDLLPEFAPLTGQRSDSQFRANLGKLTANSDYVMLGLPADDIRELSHDLTTVSRGLLTNAKSGGLKTDLSLGFEHGNFDNGYVFVEEGYAHPQGSVDVRGPSWAVFQDHYNLYKEMSYSNGIPRLDTTDAAAHGLLLGSDRNGFYNDRHGFTQAYRDPAVLVDAEAGKRSPLLGFELPRPVEVQRQPVYLGNMVIVSLEAENGKLVTVLTMVGLLWNPYNVELELHEDVMVNVEMKFGIEYRYDDPAETDPSVLPYKGRISTGAALNADGNPAKSGVQLVLGAGQRFEPGEIKLLTVGEQDAKTRRPTVASEIDYLNGYYLRSWVNPDSAGVYPYLDGDIGRKRNYIPDGNPGTDGLALPNAGSTIYVAVTPVSANSFSSSFVPESNDGTRYQSRSIKSGLLSLLPNGLTEGSFEYYSDPVAAAQQGCYMSVGLPVSSLSSPLPYPVAVMFTGATAGDNINRQLQTHTALEMHLSTNPRAFFSDSISGTYIQLKNNPFTGFEPLEVFGYSAVGDLFQGDAFAHYGQSYRNGSGQQRPVAWEFPTVPLTSIAQLQHVFFNTDAYEPSYAVGNSFASPYVSRDQRISTVVEGLEKSTGQVLFSNWSSSVIDFSYLLNEALWDDYFFSSIAPSYEQGTEQRDLNDSIDALIDGSAEFLNPRMALYQAAPELADAWKQPAGNPEKSVAGNLMVEGAFNVNSTSEIAWKAFLGGLYEQSVVGMDLADGGGSSLDLSANPAAAIFSRLTLPTLDKSYGGSSSIQNNEGSGYRALDSAELDSLAEEIVKQVRQRGPFLSLSEFVNRKLVAAPDSEGLMGPLQQAINDAGLNDDYDIGLTVDKGAGNSATAGRHDVFLEPEAGTGNPYGAGAGYLMQGDILNSLGPFMSVKSNTFTIRSYGEVEDPISGNTVTAYFEAVVQQVPDFIDDTNPADTALDDPNIRAVNLTFGRRFEIVSLRELTAEEI